MNYCNIKENTVLVSSSFSGGAFYTLMQFFGYFGELYLQKVGICFGSQIFHSIFTLGRRGWLGWLLLFFF